MTFYNSEYSVSTSPEEETPKEEKHTLEHFIGELTKNVTQNITENGEITFDHYFLVLRLTILRLKDEVANETIEFDKDFDCILDFINLYIDHRKQFK